MKWDEVGQISAVESIREIPILWIGWATFGFKPVA
jgi:hypothetical protein